MIIKYKDKVFECLLDPEDENYFSQFTWNYRCGYASRNRRISDTPGNSWVHLHHEILFKHGYIIPKGYCVDHINRNKMDNRKFRILQQIEIPNLKKDEVYIGEHLQYQINIHSHLNSGSIELIREKEFTWTDEIVIEFETFLRGFDGSNEITIYDINDIKYCIEFFKKIKGK